MNAKPLCVDLDGTLLKTDSLHELFVYLLITKPWLAILSLAVLIAKGIAPFKQYLVDHVALNKIIWVYNDDFLTFLKQQRLDGRQIILLTAANQKVADHIANELKLFDEVVGSTDKINFKAKQKLAWLQKKFGNKNFDYAGNHREDLLLWQYCGSAIIVNASPKTYHQAQQTNCNIRFFQTKSYRLLTFLRSIKAYQYAKNFLIFLPLFLSGKFHQYQLLIPCCLAFISFSLMASAIYLINDLFDIHHDRLHYSKHKRPCAAGEINLIAVLILIMIFIALSYLIAILFLPLHFLIILAIYLILNILYSSFLKKIAIIDIFILAIFYIMRFFIGTIVIDITLSNWLFAFALLFFLNLGYLKRYVEVIRLNDGCKTLGRSYKKTDQSLLQIGGMASGLLAVLVLVFYINSSVAIALYRFPEGLWIAALLLLYWINHIWYAASHYQILDDPVHFVLKDKVSLIIAFAVLMLIILCQI